MCTCLEMFMFLTILLIIPLALGAECPTDKWRRMIKEKPTCCDYCLEGQFMLRPCDTVNRTICTNCPPRTFTDVRNHNRRCNSCSMCDGENEVVQQICTRKTDTKCSCKPDHFYYGPAHLCKQCKTCTKTEGVKRMCTETSNTVCEPCQLGQTFSNGTCTKCTRCNEFETVISKCSLSKDTVCRKVMVDLESKTPDGDNERHHLIVALIASGLAILVIVPAGCIVYFCFCKKRFSSLRRHRDPSDEEEGGKEAFLMTQGPVMPLEDLKYEDIHQLSVLLDPRHHPNWRDLASKMGMNRTDIDFIASQPESSTEEVIKRFQTSRDAPTVQDLIRYVRKIKRSDTERILKNAIEVYSSQSSNRN